MLFAEISDPVMEVEAASHSKHRTTAQFTRFDTLAFRKRIIGSDGEEQLLSKKTPDDEVIARYRKLSEDDVVNALSQFVFEMKWHCISNV
ncbi:hypothetical protein FP2506_02090 [Fulvimarina pelagi HTCC2506]|uniref:Uncharacterized protein n=1 Tax=Fulvimarina pelagi HTCC2506 TaxID=314231 RepID=Q0FYK2_9HYPH|nr:hypothetical protein FP2506_02090 [Fulvimarina pelagi HTCC2506]